MRKVTALAAQSNDVCAHQDSPAPWEELVWDRDANRGGDTWQALSTCQMSGTSRPWKEEPLAKLLGCEEKERERAQDGAEQPDKACVLTAGRGPVGAGLDRCPLQGGLKLPIMEEGICALQESRCCLGRKSSRNSSLSQAPPTC